MTEIRQSTPILVLVDHAAQPGKYLLEWHEKWRCFCFPVTVANVFEDRDWGLHVTESPADAALRAAADASRCLLRKTGLRRLTQAVSVTTLSQSQGRLTGYQIDIFAYTLSSQCEPVRGCQWLDLEDITNENLGPISAVARAAAAKLRELQFEAGSSDNSALLWDVVHPVV